MFRLLRASSIVGGIGVLAALPLLTLLMAPLGIRNVSFFSTSPIVIFLLAAVCFALIHSALPAHRLRARLAGVLAGAITFFLCTLWVAGQMNVVMWRVPWPSPSFPFVLTFVALGWLPLLGGLFAGWFVERRVLESSAEPSRALSLFPWMSLGVVTLIVVLPWMQRHGAPTSTVFYAPEATGSGPAPGVSESRAGPLEPVPRVVSGPEGSSPGTMLPPNFRAPTFSYMLGAVPMRRRGWLAFNAGGACQLQNLVWRGESALFVSFYRRPASGDGAPDAPERAATPRQRGATLRELQLLIASPLGPLDPRTLVTISAAGESEPITAPVQENVHRLRGAAAQALKGELARGHAWRVNLRSADGAESTYTVEPTGFMASAAMFDTCVGATSEE